MNAKYVLSTQPWVRTFVMGTRSVIFDPRHLPALELGTHLTEGGERIEIGLAKFSETRMRRLRVLALGFDREAAATLGTCSNCAPAPCQVPHPFSQSFDSLSSANQVAGR